MFNLFGNDDSDDGDRRHRCPGEGHTADPGVHYERSHGEFRPVDPGRDRRERRRQGRH